MLKSRIIPCLLMSEGNLVKTQKFQNPKYIGDPLNAVRIFNEKKADELMLIDISATKNGTEPDFDLIEKIAYECRMPFCYGGGIKNLSQIKDLISLGIEKVSISSSAIKNFSLIADASKVVVSAPKTISPTYRLGRPVRYWRILVHFPTPSTSTPVASGSKVPECPTFLVPRIPRHLATTSWLVHPGGLSITNIPLGSVLLSLI